MKTIKLSMKLLTAVMLLLSTILDAQQNLVSSDSSRMKKMQHNPSKMKTMMHDSSNHHNMHDMTITRDSSHHKMNNNEMMSSKKSPLIREGVIDVNAIDKNRDGKVYEDMMDYNVISDKPGKCPLCGMTLKEVTIKKAKQNLKANGFKVK